MVYLNLEKVAREKEIIDCIISFRERRNIQPGKEGAFNPQESLILEYITSLEETKKVYEERLREYDNFFVTLKGFLPQGFDPNRPIG